MNDYMNLKAVVEACEAFAKLNKAERQTLARLLEGRSVHQQPIRTLPGVKAFLAVVVDPDYEASSLYDDIQAYLQQHEELLRQREREQEQGSIFDVNVSISSFS